MNLDRLPVLAATAAAALTSAGARFNKLDRRVKLVTLAAAGASLLCVAFAACNESSGGPSGSAGYVYSGAGGVDLGVFPPEGFKGTVHSVVKVRFTSGTGGFSRNSATELETVRVEKDRATFKSNTSTESEFWGNTYPNPNEDHSKRRLCICTVNRCGKVLSSEGAAPDGYTGASYPDHPVKVGETWTVELSGTGTCADSTLTVVSTLKEVVSVKGRPMAVITYTSREENERSTGTQWLDIETGLVVRNIATGSGTTPDGWAATSESNSWFTDVRGVRWVD